MHIFHQSLSLIRGPLRMCTVCRLFHFLDNRSPDRPPTLVGALLGSQGVPRRVRGRSGERFSRTPEASATAPVSARHRCMRVWNNGRNLVLVRVIVQPDPVLLQGQHVVVFGPDGETDGGERSYHDEKRETGCGGEERQRKVLNCEVAH